MPGIGLHSDPQSCSPGEVRVTMQPTIKLLDQPTKYVFFTGKGGVGKTSVSTAVSIALADAGKKVLLVSTDAASNLDEMLGIELSNQPVAVPDVPGMFVLNIDPATAATDYRARVVEQMGSQASDQDIALVREQLSGACTTEIATFDEFSHLLAQGGAAYDHVVFDTAPTGHTLRLLSLPKAWSGFLEGNDRGASCLGPHSGLKMQEQLFNQALAALNNPALTTVVLVARPDKGALAEAARSSVYLSNMIFNGDCIPYMCEADHRGMFDAIVTDIPYGIEMDTLNQDNFAHANMDTVEEEHDVEDNMQLMREFFPAAFACTKDSAFVVTWCDVMQWQFMYDLARKAGFEVQRWPITWIKTHACGNSMSQYNMTKNTEIAMVCRKPKTTLAKHTNQSTVTASNAEVKRALRHPFAKPYEVWHFILDAVTIEGQLILEPFAGSGSGVIAALQKKRRVIALEKQLGHYNNLLENVKTQHFLKLDPNYVFK